MGKKKPLSRSQEVGMLRQSSLGKFSSFVYQNYEVLDLLVDGLRNPVSDRFKERVDLLSRSKLEELEFVMAACKNEAVNRVIRSILLHCVNGIKGVAPDTHMADAMALTEANYNADEFMLPHVSIVVEVPDGCVGRLSGDFSDRESIRQLFSDFSIDQSCLAYGFEVAYVILTIHEHKEQHYEEFGKSATRTLNVEVLTNEFISGKLVRDSEVKNILGYRKNFNPAPVCMYSRPLLDGVPVEELLQYKAGRINESVGAYKVKENKIGKGDRVFRADTEYDYMIKLVRMAMNCIYAITQLGYHENKDTVGDKLRRRGSDKAKRSIPDILEPVSVITDEARKARYVDGSVGDSGIVVSPHFRRGHWRKQRYGEKLKLAKTVWIAPQVINRHLLRTDADKNVVRNSVAI